MFRQVRTCAGQTGDTPTGPQWVYASDQQYRSGTCWFLEVAGVVIGQRYSSGPCAVFPSQRRSQQPLRAVPWLVRRQFTGSHPTRYCVPGGLRWPGTVRVARVQCSTAQCWAPPARVQRQQLRAPPQACAHACRACLALCSTRMQLRQPWHRG